MTRDTESAKPLTIAGAACAAALCAAACDYSQELPPQGGAGGGFGTTPGEPGADLGNGGGGPGVGNPNPDMPNAPGAPPGPGGPAEPGANPGMGGAPSNPGPGEPNTGGGGVVPPPPPPGGGGAPAVPDDGKFRPAGWDNRIITGSWPQLGASSRGQPIAQKPGTLTYQKVTVHQRHLGESCTFGDYDGDGVTDVSAGRFWYKGPDFKSEFAYRGGHDDLPNRGFFGKGWDDPESEGQIGNSDSWASFAWDMDGDGVVDIVNASNPDMNHTENGQPKMQDAASLFWYKNPGPGGVTEMWTPHQIQNDFRHEHHGMFDVNGDGNPEFWGACLGCNEGKGYYFGDWAQPTQNWQFVRSRARHNLGFPSKKGWMHGLGYGDINGDGRPDYIDTDGVWFQSAEGTFPAGEQPDIAKRMVIPSRGHAAGVGGTQMYALDMDGDGDNDIFTSDDSHGWGTSWYEQTRPNELVRHQITGTSSQMISGIKGFSQAHSAEAVDMDFDGITDIVTGKMKWAHPDGTGDPGVREDPVLYVFKVNHEDPPQAGVTKITPTLVDSGPGSAGVGRQFAVGHINDDGIMDFCIGAKMGLYVFLGQ